MRLKTACYKASGSLRDAFAGRQPKLAFLSDFGNGDEAVHVLHEAALYANRRARITDICHNVPLGNVLVGASRLRRAVTLPTEGRGNAFVAVVDPGVGTERKGIIVKTGKGRYLVGPDNGVLSLAFLADGVERAVEIESLDYTLLRLANSMTFHGRDVFAPAAGFLLSGVPLREFGRELEPDGLRRIELDFRRTGNRLEACVIDADGCGALRTNIPNHSVEDILGREVRFRIGNNGDSREGNARVVRTFGEAAQDETVLVMGSTGFLDLAVNQRNAQETYGIGPKDVVLDSANAPKIRMEAEA